MAAKYKIPKLTGFGQQVKPKNNTAGAPRAPSAPRAPQPTYNAQAANIGSNPIGQAPKYDYLADPNFLLNQAEISQRYGVEQEKLSAASSQDRIAMERAYSVMGADKAGNFKGSVYDPSGVKNEGSYYADTQAAKVAANKAGLYSSGQLGQNLGDIQTKYTGQVGDIKQSFTNAEGNRDIARRDLTANYGPGGIQDRKAIQAAQDAFNAAAQAQASIDATNNLANSIANGGGGGAPAPAAAAGGGINYGALANALAVGGTSTASDGRTYRKASNGKLQRQNSNGTWTTVN